MCIRDRPEELGEIEEPFYKNLSFRSSEANRHGKLCFSTSLYCLCEATIAIYGGVPLMWFKRYDFDYDKWLDCGVYELDMEFLDLLGMLVRY